MCTNSDPVPSEPEYFRSDPAAGLFGDDCPVCGGRGIESVLAVDPDSTLTDSGAVIGGLRCPYCHGDEHVVWFGDPAAG